MYIYLFTLWLFILASCENGNQPTSNRALVKTVGNNRRGYVAAPGNSYGDPRLVTKRMVPLPPGSFSTSGYASSTTGDYDYADIDNFDLNGAGKTEMRTVLYKNPTAPYMNSCPNHVFPHAYLNSVMETLNRL